MLIEQPKQDSGGKCIFPKSFTKGHFERLLYYHGFFIVFLVFTVFLVFLSASFIVCFIVFLIVFLVRGNRATDVLIEQPKPDFLKTGRF